MPFVQLFQATPDSVDVAWPDDDAPPGGVSRNREIELSPGRRRPRQYSTIRVKNGVIPDLRTGLTVTLPALPEASSIWPLPR